MSGTKESAQKMMKTMLERDPDYDRKIGKIGGQNSHTGGFASNRELAAMAGSKGSKIARKCYRILEIKDGYGYYVAKSPQARVQSKVVFLGEEYEDKVYEYVS